MELLIPGLILVALMAYASTKIKKAAAKAFEAEQIEGDGFSISKPEGLLSRHEPAPLAFEAYSKAMGEKPFERLRQLTADVEILSGTDLGQAASAIRKNGVRIVSEERLDGALLIKTEETRDGAGFETYYKLVPSGSSKVYRLRVAALDRSAAENGERIRQLLDTFRVH